jgi:translocation and assembly module TamB
MRLRDAEVVLVPRGEAGNSKAPVLLNLASGTSHFLNNNQLIQFNTQGALVNGGNFTIQGESRPAVGETNLVISGTKVGAAEVGRLIQLPLLLQAGHVDGNLEIKIQPKQPLKFAGTATLNQVTARLPQLQKPFANTNGQLRFKGTQVRLEKITTLFGQIPALANGVVDTQSEINLSAQTAPVELPKILQAFDFQKLPVAVLAEVQTDLRVTGPLSKPVVSGEVRTTKLAQVDRLNFQAVSGGFKVVDSLLTINNFRATPTVGGLVTGTGQVRLGQKGTAEFDAQAINVPGDAIAKIYAINLPVPLGAVSGRTRIVTALDKPQNYRATGSANLNLAGGTVTASNIQVAEERFTAQVQASGVQLGRLASVPAQLNGPLSGTFNLSGSLASLSPSTIRGSGFWTLECGRWHCQRD